MDYDRYIELYRQRKFQEAVEYKATQVPTRLIKYYSLNDNEVVNKSKIQYLKEQRIFLSASSGFNDPFEGKFFKFDKEKLESSGWDKDMVVDCYTSLAAKHKSWEHEREYRIICHRDDFPAIPSEIYIGLNCKEEYRKELIEVGKSIDVCKVYQMEFDEDSEVFGLKKKLIIDVENKMNKS